MGAIMRDWKNELKKMELKKQDKKENATIKNGVMIKANINDGIKCNVFIIDFSFSVPA
jgi:hypothetical protein